jgi:hypothetical protein
VPQKKKVAQILSENKRGGNISNPILVSQHYSDNKANQELCKKIRASILDEHECKNPQIKH